MCDRFSISISRPTSKTCTMYDLAHNFIEILRNKASLKQVSTKSSVIFSLNYKVQS